MKKHLLITLITLSLAGWAHAQNPLTSQYMFNMALVNPAVMGSSGATDLFLGYRNQWVNYDGAPKTFFFSASTTMPVIIQTFFPKSKAGKHHRHNKTKLRQTEESYSAVGTNMYRDQIGPFVTFGMNFTYAYHHILAPNLYAALGGTLGFNQFTFDNGAVTAINQSDPLLASGFSRFVGDGMLGGWLYNDYFYAGMSLNRFNTYRGFEFSNYYVTSGVRIILKGDKHLTRIEKMRGKGNHHVVLVPSFLFKAAPPQPNQLDLNLKLRFYEMFWIGGSYRDNGNLGVLLVGFKVPTNQVDYHIGYSYDLPVSDIKYLNNGSHEIYIGLTLHTSRDVLCAHHFW